MEKVGQLVGEMPALEGNLTKYHGVDPTLTKPGAAADARVTGDKLAEHEQRLILQERSVDTTLTKAGAAADAKVTGDKLADHEQRIQAQEKTEATVTDQTRIIAEHTEQLAAQQNELLAIDRVQDNHAQTLAAHTQTLAEHTELFEEKLDANRLDDAINESLAEAAASGAFNGKDGVSVTHNWNGSVLEITSASGMKSMDLQGKTAYEYAFDGGFTGTEEEFAQRMATDYLPLAGGTMTGDICLSGKLYDGTNEITIAGIVGKAEGEHKHNAGDINAGTISESVLPTVPLTKGGTGAATAADARANLGITPANIGAEASGAVAAHNTATNAHADIRAIANAAFPKAGGTMPGNIILNNSNPHLGLQDASGNTAYFQTYDDLSGAWKAGFGYGWANSLKIGLDGTTYIPGSLSDGTNSVTVANIASKSFLGRTTAVNAADTNYTTLMARGASLNNAETTPAVNGAIAWTYE